LLFREYVMKMFYATTQNYFSKSLITLIGINLLVGSLLAATSGDAVLSLIAQSTDIKNIEQCVADVNQTSDDSLDTASRIYQTSVCYFCIGCDLEVDNGQVFEGNQVYPLKFDETYATSYRLMQQAAELGSKQANYGLAVFIYAMDLSNNKHTKQQIADKEIENSNNDPKKSNANSGNKLVAANEFKQELNKASEDLEFNSEIQIRLLNAARKGHIPAQFALSEVYSQGIGVAQNKMQAYAWAATAVAQNPPFGSYRREHHAANMDYFELNEAESLAEQFMKKYTDIFDRSSVTVMR